MCAAIKNAQAVVTLWYTPLTNMPLTKLEEQVFALEELVRRLMIIRSANSSPQESRQIDELWNDYLKVYDSIDQHYKPKQ